MADIGLYVKYFLFFKKNDLDKTCVVLDDYKSRSYYNIINQFFDVEQ